MASEPNERWPRWIAEAQTIWFKAGPEACLESYGTARSRSAAVRLAGMLQEYSYRQHALEARATHAEERLQVAVAGLKEARETLRPSSTGWAHAVVGMITDTLAKLDAGPTEVRP